MGNTIMIKTTKTSRSLTRPRCVTCGRSFVARRADAAYCSGKCRQRANRARQTTSDIDREIEATRLHYWELVRRKAEARGVTVSQILTDKAKHFDAEGRVLVHAIVNGQILIFAADDIEQVSAAITASAAVTPSDTDA